MALPLLNLPQDLSNEQTAKLLLVSMPKTTFKHNYALFAARYLRALRREQAKLEARPSNWSLQIVLSDLVSSPLARHQIQKWNRESHSKVIHLVVHACKQWNWTQVSKGEWLSRGVTEALCSLFSMRATCMMAMVFVVEE